MKVSVCMITYNQEKYIEQAVESVMMQETDFEYELVIGEDCSTDRTRDILLKLKAKYPDKIRLLLRDQNLGAAKNFADTLKACRGEYVALLEGDDYWTCAQKLKRQADLLDTTPECALCFHTVLDFDEKSNRELRQFPPPGQPYIHTLPQLFLKFSIKTCSMMYRREYTLEYPSWMLDSTAGDWPLCMIIAQYGDIRYIDEVMANYRIHTGGVWAGTQGIWKRYVGIKIIKNMDRHTNFKYHYYARISLSRQYAMLARDYIHRNRLSAARKALKISMRECPPKKLFSETRLLKVIFRLWYLTFQKRFKRHFK